jgi:release factor glutamine methyltransferase
MQRRKALECGLQTLKEHSVASAQLAAELLLMHTLGIDRAELYTEAEAELPPELESRFLELIRERAAGKPVQYLTGHQEFWGLDFEVSPDVLIPRPESELLVETVIELARGKAGRSGARLRVVDVGTGSGCIAIALAKELPEASIVATDISRPALVLAAKNAKKLGMVPRIGLIACDLLECFGGSDDVQFDFAVSNPPYVSRDELGGLQREVRDFEPRIALGGFDRNDEVYRRLAPQAWSVLKPGGCLIVEIGYNMAEKVSAMLGESWAGIEIRPDLAGIPRAVIARKV